MSEREPMAGRETRSETIADVQRASRQREEEIERLIVAYRTIESESAIASDQLWREFPNESEERTSAWKSRCLPLIEKRKAAALAVASSLSRHYKAQDAAAAPVSDETYSVTLMFPTCKGGVSMQEIRVNGYDTVGTLISNVRGAISMEGVHNFGFDTDAMTRVGELEYAIRGNNDFYFSGKCWIDNSGHIVREIR